MTGPAGWGVSWSAVAVAATCAVILHQFSRHGHRLPPAAHPWLLRAVIAGMYASGCAIALTPLGGYVLAPVQWATGLVGGTAHGPGHAIAITIGVFLFLAVAIGVIWVPDPEMAWLALALPFAAALSGGHLHGLLTVLPVISWCQDIAHWIGG